jgi:hypothetical protein
MRYFVISVMICIANLLYAQIQTTTTLPKSGFETRIRQAVNEIWIIDTHEHLETEEQRLEQTDLDFTYLFKHYAIEDLVSASNLHGLISVIFSGNFALEDRWNLFKPYFEAMRNTGYGRVPLIVANDLFEIDDINDDTYELLSKKVMEAAKPGYYKYVLKDRARIDLSIQDSGHRKFDRNFYRHVERFDNFIFVFDRRKIKSIGLQYNIKVQTLPDFVEALRLAFKQGVDYEMIGIKSGLAYNRILKYEKVSEETASGIFARLMQQPDSLPPLSFEAVKPLQDYMMHRVLDLAAEYDLPVQIHTGLHAGNGNIITNSKPTHLVNLFMEYPEVNFCLFHSSYPYGGELSTLAKNFPNVFIDMCWSAIISPSYSKRYLHEWLETVPANKIMAFGGDYGMVECIYGHAVMARRIVASVLIEKVADGYFSEKEAIRISKRLLRENALEVFKLKGKDRGLAYIDEATGSAYLKEWLHLHKSPDGLIHDWHVIGPFDYGKGLDDELPLEKNIDFDQSYEGADGLVKWKKFQANKSGYLDLSDAFYENPEDNPADLAAMGYAYIQIKSPDERKIRLTLGSNDGAKLWVNNEVIYNKHIGRGALADQVFLNASLKKGINHILVKVENLGYNWGLYLRVVDTEKDLVIGNL